MQQLPDRDAEYMKWIDVLLKMAIQGGALNVNVFLHRRMGNDYLSLPRFLGAMMWQVVFISYCQSFADYRAIFIYSYVFVGAFALQMLGKRIRYHTNDHYEHSHYPGYPRICDFTRLSEDLVKQWLEPLIFITGGVLVADQLRLPMFGLQFMAYGMFHFLDRFQAVDRVKRRVQTMIDGEIISDEMFEWYDKVKGGRR